ncbi:MAG: patatin-like phospholipase family protein [Bacteroidota bacterium]
MSPARIYNERIRRIIYFFPFQLLVLHFKRSQMLILFWLILFGFISKTIAIKYGIPYLFLSPEYLSDVGFWSYLIMGLSCGAFIMTYNIASYVTNGSRFPFIATLNRPFLKYSINNLIIPLIFVITYIYFIISFHKYDECHGIKEILFDISGLVGGILFFLVFSYIYFFSTNKNIFKLFGIKPSSEEKETKAKLQKEVEKHGKKRRSIMAPLKSVREWKVLTYLSNPFKIRLARGVKHYDKEMITKVFNQNHNNATLFQILIFISLIVLGLFREVSFFQIPAGSSIVLLFTMFLIITSVLYTWLRGWVTTVFIILFLILNYFSQFEIFSYKNKTYGLDYTVPKVEYSNEALKDHASDLENYLKDISYTREILKKWKLKNSPVTTNKPGSGISKRQKPKLVLINTSGGGLKSARWSFFILQHADSILNGELLKHTQLITGSSGGLIGASYLRELYLRYLRGELQNYYSNSYLENISKDILNPIAFSIAVSDMFLSFQKIKVDGYSYLNDRAYAFEAQLNKNTEYVLDKRLTDYKQAEAEALVPMIIFSPTIVNDGRRLLISPLPISYLTQNPLSERITNNALAEEIEFSRFFRRQNAENTKFTSILRMNATFPYIMPMVSLPSEPTIEVIDAGARDNYGLQTTMKFIYIFRDWISSNTSGIIILSIRERLKEFPIESTPNRTIIERFSTPIGSFYDNLFYIQDYNNDQLLQYASQWFDGEIDVIDFQLRSEKDDKISLSWHLTNKEKKQIIDAVNHPRNQKAIQKLMELLK